MDKQKRRMIQALVNQIEQQLGWGAGENWSNKDFEDLSERIFEVTKKRLSVTTLKRIWGRAEMVANPSSATLDILSEFVGFKNWRDFVQSNDTNTNFSSTNRKKKYFIPLLILSLLGGIALVIIFFWPRNQSVSRSAIPFDASEFVFHSTVVSDEIPNSVIFEYDASRTNDTSIIEIQQSWDNRKRIKVNKRDSIATCIYYRPGFFKSKLVIDGAVVKENDVFIQTQNWLGMIERDSIPIYLGIEEIRHENILGVGPETLSTYEIDPRISEVVTGLYYVKDFREYYTDDFEMSMLLKNTTEEGLGGCQEIEVFILYDGGAIGIPLAKKGCISNLNLMAFGNYIDGKKNDLSAFGVSFEDYVGLKCISKEGTFQIYVGGELAYEVPVENSSYSIKGLSLHFKGTGTVKDVEIKNSQGQILSLD